MPGGQEMNACVPSCPLNWATNNNSTVVISILRINYQTTFDLPVVVGT
jgi:hypothetical protein